MTYACATLGVCCVFPRVFIHSRVTGACPVFFGGCMSCISYYVCVHQCWLVLCFPWGILPLKGDWGLSCDHQYGPGTYVD